MTPRSPRRRSLVAALAGVTTALSGLAVVTAAPPAAANPDGTGLVISEVYGGGGNNGAAYRSDFIELYNPTDSAISVDGLSVQYRSSGGGSGGSPVALTGSVPAHGHYLIKAADGSDGTLPALPTPDATTTFNMSATQGQVLLINGTSFTGTGDVAGDPGLVDMVGFGGSNTYETAPAPSTSNSTSVSRDAAGADTDDNASDFTTGAPTPQNAASASGELAAVDQADVNAVLNQAIAPFTLQATGGTPAYEWEVVGLPPGLTATVDGEVSGEPTEAGLFAVTATVTDAEDASDSTGFTVTVTDPDAVVPIAEIQGTDTATSPLVGQTVTTEGVVTAKYDTGNYNGMYIQTAGSGGDTDATPGASDAIFVYGPHSRPDEVEIGDSVRVTGAVSEFAGTTEITPDADGVVEIASLGEVTPRTVVPGTDCPLPGDTCLTGAALDEAREAFEGELFQPTGDYTVTDVHDGSAYNGVGFSSNMFGEIGLAAESDIPLVTPTEVIDAQDTPAIEERTAYNDAHRMILDDGASVTYWNTSNTADMDQPFPWFTEDNFVRVGAAVTFVQPVVMEWRNNTWKLQPQVRVTDDGADRVAFEQDRPAQPEDVGGDLKLGTFNVLNYFTTLGVDYGGCEAYVDREGNPIAVDDCGPTGPRGAWDQASFERQEAKIVEAINTMDADIMALEEIENSAVVDGSDRDEAVETLVAALNDDAGSTRWAFVDSPATVDPGEDVIRTAIIYNPATVELVGDSALFYDSVFANAREPFAQTFKAAGGADADGFAVIANHFKSKGSGENDGTGQGNANPDRIAQAAALAGFAEDFAGSNGVQRVFLTGDFNAYSQEDPMQVLYDAGYTNLESTSDPHEESYNFDGMIGSLDHVLANDAALADVEGVDIWTINAYESQYYEYSRYNYNVRPLYAEGPFRASDHNPELVGINVPDGATDTTVSATGGTFEHGTPWSSTVTVAPSSATGQVEILDGSTSLGTATLSGGTATIDFTGTELATGTHTLTVRYDGDAEHAASSSTFTVTITVTPPTQTTLSTWCPEVQLGTDWSVHATVSPASASGSVEVRDGGDLLGTGLLSGGEAVVPVAGDALPVGTHTLTVRYVGDGDHAASETTCTVTVTDPDDGETETVVQEVSDLVYGQGGTISVTVTGTGPVTGTVELLEGETLIGSAELAGGAVAKQGRAAAAVGTATIVVPPTALTPGTHPLTVRYGGDDANAPSETTVEVEVAKAPSATSLSVAPVRAVVGQDRINLVAEVAATGVDPTGEVVFSANGIEIGSAPVTGTGTATLRLGPGHTVARFDLIATYQGDDLVEASTATATLRVVKAPVSIRAKVKPQRIVVDRTTSKVRVAVRAAGQKVTGKVRVRGNGKVRTVRLKNGKARVVLGRWHSAGQKTVRVQYLGSGKAKRASTKVTFRVRGGPRR